MHHERKLLAMKVGPTGGTRAFRNRTSVGVENRTLTATNRKGVERRFPLDGGPSSPARHVTVVAEPDGAFRTQWAILDGNEEALLVGFLGDWDSLEMDDVERAAGLKPGIENRPAPRTEVRRDGLILEDGTWWQWAPKAGMVAFVLAGITNAGFLPAVVGWPVVAALMVFLVLGMTSGAYGKHRPGKSAAAHAALRAGDDEAFDKALEEAHNSPLVTDPEPPEAAT
jgi:hypothetical protein